MENRELTNNKISRARHSTAATLTVTAMTVASESGIEVVLDPSVTAQLLLLSEESLTFCVNV